MNTTGKPELRLLLPGEWVKVSLDDPRQVDAFLDLAADADLPEGTVEELRTTLLLATAGGGDLVLLRASAQEPTMIVTSWPVAPDAPEPGVDALRDWLGPVEGGDITTLDHVGGFAVLRRVAPSEDSRVQVTYWISHPATGRVLCLDVVVFGGAAEAEGHLRRYDLLAANVGWDEGLGG